jgi:hypothetical protein
MKFVFVRGPLSLVSIIEELLGRKSSSSILESRQLGRRDPSRWPRGTLYPQKLALTLPTSGCRSVGIVHSQTEAIEFSFSFFVDLLLLWCGRKIHHMIVHIMTACDLVVTSALNTVYSPDMLVSIYQTI